MNESNYKWVDIEGDYLGGDVWGGSFVVDPSKKYRLWHDFSHYYQFKISASTLLMHAFAERECYTLVVFHDIAQHKGVEVNWRAVKSNDVRDRPLDPS